MKTCGIMTGNWSPHPCGKMAVEELRGVPMCKTHAKAYRVRNDMDTGEVLHTRYMVARTGISSGNPTVIKVDGLVGKKQFTVRKYEILFGNGKSYYEKYIPIDSGNLFEDLEMAKKHAAKWLNDLLAELEEDKKELQELKSKIERN